jgi:hypothetical protein
VSQRDFYAFHLQSRANNQSPLLRGGLLLQEFCVDAYCQIEQSRINWINRNQGILRAESYRGIVDALANGADLDKIGKRVILPSTFIGGPRNMNQLYHDAMAIVRSRGKPDLFITVTCNPVWPEILEAIDADQKAEDRPDIVARVFKLKLDAIMNDIVHEKVFGETAGQVYTIEFQKRGLPHAHILIILHSNYRPHNTDDIDAIVSAEIPNPLWFPNLHSTVVAFMLHGPCGDANPRCACMKNGRCSRRYPKPFCDDTIMGDDSYPQYRRRNDDIHYDKNGFRFTNQYVIPYNPYLSAKYNCHINVEIASSIMAVKYLYKYIHKGHDRTAIQIERDGTENNNNSQQNEINHNDEPQSYIDARYVGPVEACWRIYKFPLHYNYPSVTRLSVHDINGQFVQFDPENPSFNDVLCARPTTLTAFFELCRSQPDLTVNLLYPDCPSKFKWNKKSRCWKLRAQGTENTNIGRIYFLYPSAGDTYYLRLLLYHVTSPTCFRDLKVFNGIEYPSYHAACGARGLIESDNEWDLCMQEAAAIQTGSQLRQLFVAILLHNTPMDPRVLYDTHIENMSDDYRRRLSGLIGRDATTEEIYDYALQDIEARLNRANCLLEDFNLPKPHIDFSSRILPRIIQEELDYDRDVLQEKWLNGYDAANPDQRAILDAIQETLASGESCMLFIDGPGGTGKTFLENLILAQVRARGLIALAVASSGIASILLDGGRTSHSRFRIPLTVDLTTVCDIPAQSHLAELIRRTSVIIWDEAPAQNRLCFEAVDRTFKDIRKCDLWFGGIIMIFAGTFPIAKFY